MLLDTILQAPLLEELRLNTVLRMSQGSQDDSEHDSWSGFLEQMVLDDVDEAWL